MTKDMKLYIFTILLLLELLIFRNIYLVLLFSIISLAVAIKLFGFPTNKSYLKDNTIRSIIISLLLYFLISYLFGLITGFLKMNIAKNIFIFMKNIGPLIIAIVCRELTRHIIANQSKNNIKPYILLTLIYIIIDLGTNTGFPGFSNREALFIYTTVTVISTISYEALYSYLTYKTGYTASLLLNSILNLYMYILPIIPNLGNYINSVIGVVFPIIIYNNVNKVSIYYDKSDKYINKLKLRYITVPITLVLLVLVILISGFGKYQLVAIASGSMEKVIYRGDAIMMNKKYKIEDYNIGDVLAYKNGKKLIAHRIVGKSYQNGEYVFITKGDNNNYNDINPVKESQVVGYIFYRVKYIGYPTVWFNEFIDKL